MAQTSVGHVFMSYSRRDEAVMRRIATFLRKQGINVWVDNEKLVPGTPIWEEEIEKAIKSASSVIVILSPDSKNSEWVRREISLADQYRTRIFPVLVRGDEEASITLRLITRQYVDIRQNEEVGLNSLRAALSFYLEELKAQERVAREEAERLAHEKAEREAAKKAAKEKVERQAEERAAHEIEEREAVEKAIREKAELEAAEKAASRKTTRELTEEHQLREETRHQGLNLRKQKLQSALTLIFSKQYLLLKITILVFGFGVLGTWLIFIAPHPIPTSLEPITASNATSMTEVASRNLLKIASVLAFSPDGKIIAVNVENDIRIMDASNLTIINVLKGHTSGIEGFSFSPDGQILVSASADSIRLWNTVGEKQLLSFSTLVGLTSVSAIAISPDGHTIASNAYDNTIRLWNIDTGALIKTIKGEGEYEVYSVTFSPDGQTIAAGSDDGIIRIWRVSDGTQINTFRGHTSYIVSVTFSPNGDILASGSLDHTIKLWRVSDGILLNTLDSHSDSVSIVAFSPDGVLLASGSYDTTVRIWRISDGALIQTLWGHKHYVFDVTFSPNGKLLASCAQDSTIRFWGVPIP